MRRVSTDMPNTDLQYRLRRIEADTAAVQAKMGTQSKIKELRDDPIAASHAVRYDSYLSRLQRYEKNVLYAEDHLKTVDGYLQQATGLVQRVRELGVQGATGTYSKEDLRYMAVEVDQLLGELVQVANATGPDGTRLFAGDKSFTEPFRVVQGPVDGAGGSVIASVEYQGAGASRKAEISDGAVTDLDLSGGEAFWAERMQVFSSFDATAYKVPDRSSILVDGKSIDLEPGDGIYAIVAKINDSGAPVRAYVDPESRGLALEGLSPHRVVVEDGQGSSVLRDLGLIARNAEGGAPNWSPSARVSGGSAFDMVIRLRDALYRGDTQEVGSRGLAGMDLALDNLAGRLAEVGSRQERVQATWKRVNAEIPDATAQLDREKALDFSQAATELSMLEFTHKAALSTAAKVLQPTLLDFLR